MKKTALYFILLFASANLHSQDFYPAFVRYFQDGDTAMLHDVLYNWQRSFPHDAEMQASWSNYYYLKTRMEKDTVLKMKFFVTSMNQADTAVKYFPNRLDIRFGKIYILGQEKMWNAFTADIIEAVNYSAVNNNKWTWTRNEPKSNGKEFFLSSLQHYQALLFNAGDKKLMENIGSIARTILKYYPDHVESMSDLAMTLIIAGKADVAVDLLLKAESLKPSDVIVLSNLANAYKVTGNKEKAVEYYNKCRKYGDAEMQKYADDEISKISLQ
jgi:tetratricopeptide (TPR) repeat protein